MLIVRMEGSHIHLLLVLINTRLQRIGENADAHVGPHFNASRNSRHGRIEDLSMSRSPIGRDSWQPRNVPRFTHVVSGLRTGSPAGLEIQYSANGCIGNPVHRLHLRAQFTSNRLLAEGEKARCSRGERRKTGKSAFTSGHVSQQHCEIGTHLMSADIIGRDRNVYRLLRQRFRLLHTPPPSLLNGRHISSTTTTSYLQESCTAPYPLPMSRRLTRHSASQTVCTDGGSLADISMRHIHASVSGIEAWPESS